MSAQDNALKSCLLAREALAALLRTVRNNAPELSGKTLGDAEAAIKAIDALEAAQQAAPEPQIDGWPLYSGLPPPAAQPAASWDWLRGVMGGIPTRMEFIGGQQQAYIAKEAVMGWLHEGQSRAAKSAAAQPMRQPLAESQLRALIERECGPVQRISDMTWAIAIARAIERVHGIGDAS